MAKIAELLKRQLRAAVPENYTLTRAIVYELFADFTLWFSETDPDFLPRNFYELIFEDYPAELYG